LVFPDRSARVIGGQGSDYPLVLLGVLSEPIRRGGA
jgi:hypothetical protein